MIQNWTGLVKTHIEHDRVKFRLFVDRVHNNDRNCLDFIENVDHANMIFGVV